MIYTTNYESPVGNILLAENGICLTGLWIEGQKYFFDSAKYESINKETPLLTDAQRWLDRYFDGKNPKISELPLSPTGSDFRQQVWKILCEIPYGETTTYGEIANKISKQNGKEKMSAQAIGGAVGHNHISIIIPCHRVVGANGNLTGYAAGIDTKIKLLKHEGVDISKLFIPQKGTAL